MSSPHPGLAAALTWAIPGAGHLYLGQTRTAAIGFVVVQALFAAGVVLSGGAFMEILPPEMRGMFAGALTPEAGNLGALFLQLQVYGLGDVNPRVLPDTLHLGTMLTASSGVLNLLLASRAHFDARAQGLDPQVAPDESVAPHPARAALLGWLVPGAGHVAQGRVGRGVLVFVMLVGTFVLGTVLAEGSNLSRVRHFYYWGGQVFLGPVAFVIEMIHGHGAMTRLPAYNDAGIVSASIAGMLNVLCLLDVYGYSDARRMGRPLPSRLRAEQAGGEVAA